MEDFKKSILIVDDEPALREVLIDYFAQYYDAVYQAENGREALQIVLQEKITVILSDMFMPSMKGDEFLRQLRAAGFETPVVFLSGNADKEVVVTALRLGASDVVDKPVDLDVLSAKIEKVIEIERRKHLIHVLESQGRTGEAQKEKKMLGLLQVVNEKKSAS